MNANKRSSSIKQIDSETRVRPNGGGGVVGGGEERGMVPSANYVFTTSFRELSSSVSRKDRA